MNRRSFLAAGAALAAAGVTGAQLQAAPVRPAFEFQSRFWMNLHHALYYQAQVLETAYQAGPDRLSPMDAVAFADLRALAANGGERWYAALRLYHRNYTRMSFVFDDAMRRIDEALSRAEGDSLPARHLPEPLLQAFDLAAPLYRTRQWARDDEGNRAFIEGVRGLLESFGDEFAAKLPVQYATPWLAQPYVVDVMPYANAEGSYSNLADGFVHVAMSTQDPVERGEGGIDVLFHEASHSIADPFAGSIGAGIAAAAERAGRPYPDDFWHTVIMYAPGEIAERVLPPSGGKPYRMFALEAGLFTRVWPRYYTVLQAHWQPYANGAGTLDEALAACVGAIYAV